MDTWRTKTHVSFLQRTAFVLLVLWSESSIALYFQKNNIQIVMLAFNRLQKYVDLYQTLQWNVSIWPHMLYSWTFCTLLMFVSCSFCFLIQDVLVLFFSIHTKPTLQAHLRFHFCPKYLLCLLQPITVSPTTIFWNTCQYDLLCSTTLPSHSLSEYSAWTTYYVQVCNLLY